VQLDVFPDVSELNDPTNTQQDVPPLRSGNAEDATKYYSGG
jgi:hypothetical protein